MKNTLIGILLIVSVGSLAFGYIQYSKLAEAQSVCASEKVALEKLAHEQEIQAREFRKMAELARQEMDFERHICEEQLKAMKKK
jgi:DNA-binding ferritin-like protein